MAKGSSPQRTTVPTMADRGTMIRVKNSRITTAKPRRGSERCGRSSNRSGEVQARVGPPLFGAQAPRISHDGSRVALVAEGLDQGGSG